MINQKNILKRKSLTVTEYYWTILRDQMSSTTSLAIGKFALPYHQ